MAFLVAQTRARDMCFEMLGNDLVQQPVDRPAHGSNQVKHGRTGLTGSKCAIDRSDLPRYPAHARDEIGIGTGKMRHTPSPYQLIAGRRNVTPAAISDFVDVADTSRRSTGLLAPPEPLIPEGRGRMPGERRVWKGRTGSHPETVR